MAPEREGNGNNPLIGAPVWLRATVLLGAPTMIALGLVYWLTVGADAKLSHIENIAVTEAVAGIAHDDRTRDGFTKLEAAQNESARILIALCVNAAKDETARNRCLGR